MEACVRGFSNTFMPENQVEVMDLQVVEGGELERAWKSTRRQRVAQQEQAIWEQFVREQDVLKNVLKDDPYQFLEHLPEEYLKELMESELQRMKQEHADEEVKKDKEQESTPLAAPAPPPLDGASAPPANVTLALVDVSSDVFHIFSDDKESGDEDEGNESMETPHTVRVLMAEGGGATREGGGDGEGGSGGGSARLHSRDVTNEGKSRNKSSENVANLIESSIYCAKVKELRAKIGDELVAIMNSLETQNLANIEPVELRRMCKRSAEFCGRFQRIHLYQLQRQMHDLKRHNALALPFAKYTQFQSQMTRIVSLHQNMLQSFQVFHKSFEQTACLRESGEQLSALAMAVRDAGAACAHCAAPPHCAAATELYSDELNVTCDKMELAVKAYTERVASFLVAMESCRGSTTRSKKSVDSKKSSKIRANFKPAKNALASAAATSARLSMYSMDTLRLNVPPAGSRDNNHSGGTSKARVSSNGSAVRVRGAARGQPATNSRLKKSPRVSRRPLMRAPREGKPRRRAPRDSDIQTMVEAVDVPSSQISRDPSPVTDLQSMYSNVYNVVTPRRGGSPVAGASAAPARTPRARPPRPAPPSPRAAPPRPARAAPPPRARARVPALPSIRSETHETELTQDNPPMSPVSHIRCAVREQRDAEPLGERPPEETNEPELLVSARLDRTPSSGRKERERIKVLEHNPAGYEVNKLLRQLCGGDASGTRSERVHGAKNAQLLCVTGSSPRQPSTPQLLRILEETIQKQAPKPMYQKPTVKDADRLKLTFNISPKTTDGLLQYRTKFVQHMLTSSMYANSAVGKPWEMIGSVSEEIIAELLARCAREMEIQNIVQELYECETK